MLRYKIFSCTCTDTWCYINRPSLVFAQALEVIRSCLVLAHLHRRLGLVLRQKIFPRTCTDTWCCVTGCWATGEGGPPSGRGSRGVAGLGDHTIYGMEYICIYGMIYSKKQTMHSLVAKHINYWHPHGFFPVPGRHSNILVPKIWGTKKSLHALDISHQKLPSLDDFLGVKKCWRSKKYVPLKIANSGSFILGKQTKEHQLELFSTQKGPRASLLSRTARQWAPPRSGRNVMKGRAQQKMAGFTLWLC